MDFQLNKKNIGTFIMIALAAVIITYLAVRVGKKFADQIGSNRKSRELDGAIDKKNLTYDDTQYDSFAKTLYNSMKGVGTDEAKIKEVFASMETRSDVLKLIASFGVKDGMDLGEWIDDDLSTDDKEIYINKVLKSKAIEYTF